MGSSADPREEDVESASTASGLPPIALGAITFGILLFYFWLSGSFLPEEGSGFWPSPAKATGSTLTYSATPAFLVAAVRAVGRRTHAMLDRLCASKTIDRASVTAILTGNGFAPTVQQNAIATLVGLILGAFNVPWDRVFAELGSPTAAAAASIAVGNLLTWVAVSHAAYRRFAISNQVRKLGRDHAKVDLFRLDALLPFGRIGTLDLLVVAVTVSFAAFQSLDAELLWENYSSALSAGIPVGVGLLLLPMLGIRRNVRERKREALASVNALIGQASRELDPDSMRYLGDLLARRERLESVREWPLDTTALSRIAVYFVVPPLAWLGGALVEILLNAVLDTN